VDGSLYIQPNIIVLSPEAITLIHQSSLKILSEIGVRVDSAKATKYFKTAPGVKFLYKQHLVLQPEVNEETLSLSDMIKPA